MIQGNPFNLVSVFENSILNILQATQVSKAAGLNNLSGHFLKDGENLCNLSIISEKFPDSCRVVKPKPLHKEGSLTQPYIYVTHNIN